MKRSAGVTAAAIVAMLGSAFTLFMAVVTGLGVVLVRYLPQQNGIAPVGAAAAVGPILFYLALGGCGFATALGVLKLRPWSRISMIIFGGFTAVICVFTGLLMFFIPMPAVPNSTLTASEWSNVRVVMLAMFGIPAAIGIWWLVFFNLKSTREQFVTWDSSVSPIQQPVVGGAGIPLGAPVARPARPVSITIVACLFLLGALSLPYGLTGRHPTAFFGRLIWGRSAAAIVVLTFALTLYVGIGLLKLRPEARIIGISLTLYGFVNSLLLVLLPGAEGRLRDMLGPAQDLLVVPINTFLWMMRFSLLVGAALSIAILWMLFANKAAFRRA
jgi:hypothetical protein